MSKKPTQVTNSDLADLSLIALLDYPNSTREVRAIYILSISPHWRSKGYFILMAEMDRLNL